MTAQQPRIIPPEAARRYAAGCRERGFNDMAEFWDGYAVLGEQRDAVLALLAALVDRDDCWFDHHGGCQAHGFLSLQPGELCPHAEAKVLLQEVGSADA